MKRYLTTNQLDFISHHSPQPADLNGVSGKEFHPEDLGLRETLEVFEKEFICKKLQQNRWHRGKTARILNIPERTLYRKLKQFQLISS